MHRPFAHLVAVSCVAACAPALAESPISAERPSFSTSPVALASGRWQLEGGVQLTRIDGDADAQSLPLLLVRAGLADTLELQVGWSGRTRVDTPGGDVDGATDASVGVKWELGEPLANTPVALFVGATLPVGSREFTTDEVEPLVGLFWSHEGAASLFGTVLVSEARDDRVVTGAVGMNLPSRGDVGSYVEYAGIFQEGQGPQHIVNGGLSLLRGNDLVFDVNVGIGVNDRAPDFYVGAGLARRF